MTFRDYSEATTWKNAAGTRRAYSRNGVYEKGVKRCLDLALIVLTLPLSLPIILGMAALVALDGNSPFYFQKRLGKRGRVFHMLKMRTMVPGADKLLARHLVENDDARLEWEKTQKLKNDPRITRLGSFLRKSSLDELPQLWNVLKGDMSLVGPRPMMVEQETLYPGTAYFELRPGITGSWQVSERNQSTFAERAGFDNSYLASLSLSQDVSILWKTVSVVLRGTGY
ncbi:sugar transferase [Roseovarius sp.]|uniref:sugar transferase n=1 Tax=Roseovarius sp. TaxID=1486281 RepID=UPI003D0EC1D3